MPEDPPRSGDGSPDRMQTIPGAESIHLGKGEGPESSRRSALSIRLKLMLYFLVLVFLPLLTLGIIGPSLYARSIERETTSYASHMIAQVTANIDFHVLEMERLIDLLVENGAVASFLRRGNGTPGEKDEIDRAMAAMSDTHPEIAGILIVSKDDSFISDDFYRITRDPLTSEYWYSVAAGVPGDVRLFSRPIGRNIRSKRMYGPEKVVSIVKAITERRTGRVQGEILIDMKLSAIEDVFSGTSVGKNGFLFIADPEGELVYAPVNRIVYRIPLADLSDDSSSAIIGIGGMDYQVLSQRSIYSGWRTIGVFSLLETLHEVLLIRYWSLIIGGITTTLAIVAALFFTASIARPVLSLKQLMKRVEDGDLTVRFSGGTGDEISELGGGFNEMISRIQGLIEQVYREQHAKREAELGILQEQIKPHFLYNTLDTIQWMAQEHRVDDVVSMVGALTRLFRIGLSKGRELISLSDELEHVESYLCIQKMRYEDKFDYEILKGETVTTLHVLRLILQPLVENAIYHGIKERRGRGRLSVRAVAEGGELRLTVQDDGAGFTSDRLDLLNASLEGECIPETVAGYGIRNVHERIRLTFGKPFGLSFSSAAGEGTVVLVRHPLIAGGDL